MELDSNVFCPCHVQCVRFIYVRDRAQSQCTIAAHRCLFRCQSATSPRTLWRTHHSPSFQSTSTILSFSFDLFIISSLVSLSALFITIILHRATTTTTFSSVVLRSSASPLSPLFLRWPSSAYNLAEIYKIFPSFRCANWFTSQSICCINHTLN